MKGIRINDSIENILTIKLQDIFYTIQRGSLFNWRILYFQGDGTLQDGTSIMDFEKRINSSEDGIHIKWDELNQLANSFSDVWNILIIGCKDVKKCHRYRTDQEMYENCDIVIELIDSNFWEVFSTDDNLISSLSIKFKDTTFINIDLSAE